MTCLKRRLLLSSSNLFHVTTDQSSAMTKGHIFTSKECATAYALAAERLLGNNADFLKMNPKLKSLPTAADHLKPGITLQLLEHTALPRCPIITLQNASTPPAPSSSNPSSVGPSPPPDSLLNQTSFRLKPELEKTEIVRMQ